LDIRVTLIKGTIFLNKFFRNPKISLLILDELKKIGYGESGEIHHIDGARAIDSLQD
jgi:hypothetical protein